MAEGRWSRAVPCVIGSCCALGAHLPTSVIEAPPRVTPVTESGLGAVSLHASAFLGGVSDVIETLNEVVSSLLKTASSRRPSFCAAYAVRFPLAFKSTPSIVAPANCWAMSMP